MESREEKITTIKLGIKLIALILIGLLISLTGWELNNITINANGGLMGAYTNAQFPENSKYLLKGDEVHFYYNNFNSVKYPYLTDIIQIGRIPFVTESLGFGGQIYSIGDFIILFGKGWFSFFALFSIPYLIYKTRKLQYEQKFKKRKN